MISIELPLPPSVNDYYGHDRRTGHTYLKPHGKAYRKTVKGTVIRQRAKGAIPREPVAGALCVVAVICPPDDRVHDLDNFLKALLDSLTRARVWVDDRYIDDLRIVRGDVVPNGAAVVTIRTLSERTSL